MASTPKKRASDNAVKLTLAGIGLFFVTMLTWETLPLAMQGQNDFAPLYVGGRLAGTPDLWSPEAYFRFLQDRFGSYGEALSFVRPPFYAGLLWPLSQASYETAYLIWTLLRVAALAGFVWLWRLPSRMDALMFTAVSLPAMAGLVGGQDTAFVLLLVTVALGLEAKGKPLAAGAALSLCAIKFHLFLPLPLLFLAQKRGDVTKGFLAGGGVLTVLSFLAGGWNWPALYWRTMTAGSVHPRLDSMPNLRGLLERVGDPLWLEATMAAGVLGLAWMGMRRTDFLGGMALALVSGLLVTPHAYAPDCLLLIPAGLTALSRGGSKILAGMTMVVLWPPVYLVLLSGSAWHALMPAALLTYFGLMVRTIVRSPEPARAPAVPA